MQRHRYKPITVPILIQCDPDEQEGTVTFAGGDYDPILVRVFRAKDMLPIIREMEPIEMRVCGALLSLKKAMGSRKASRIEEAHRKLDVAFAEQRRESTAREFIKDEDLNCLYASNLAIRYGLKPDQRREAAEIAMGIRLPDSFDRKQMLAGQLTERLFGVRLVLWSSRVGLRLALFARTAVGAICAHLLMNLGLAACAQCGILFQQRRNDQIYCCEAHGNAHRVAKHRSKHRESSS